MYWYLCGSDLESNYGCATTDLLEMLEVQLPENVNVVIQTGGAAVWQNDQMDPSKLQRWLFDSEGIGIEKEHLPRLCERFYRVDKSHSKRIGGTGLGLAIVKHICAISDAELSIESEFGIGTTVTVVLEK